MKENTKTKLILECVRDNYDNLGYYVADNNLIGDEFGPMNGNRYLTTEEFLSYIIYPDYKKKTFLNKRIIKYCEELDKKFEKEKKVRDEIYQKNLNEFLKKKEFDLEKVVSNYLRNNYHRYRKFSIDKNRVQFVDYEQENENDEPYKDDFDFKTFIENFLLSDWKSQTDKTIKFDPYVKAYMMINYPL